MLNLEPCAMLPPHYHHRAANYVVAFKGNTTTYMFEENGTRLVKETFTPSQATIFPQASMHMMENLRCEPAQLVSALNSEDAGTQNIANVFTDIFPSILVDAAMGSDPSGMCGKVVPIGTGANRGSAECLARCGIDAGNRTSRAV